MDGDLVKPADPSFNHKTARVCALAFRSSLSELLDLLRHGAQAELVLRTEHPLASSLGRNTAEDDAIEQRVAAKAVVTMDAAGHLARSVESRDRLASRAEHCRVNVDFEATHAIVDDWSDDSNKCKYSL